MFKITNNKTNQMKSFKLKTIYKQILADTITPVSVYLKIRDKFPNSLLLESSDYHGNDNSFSYICCNPIASIKIENETIFKTYPDGSSEKIAIDSKTNIPEVIQEFSGEFQSDKNNFKFINNGLFGYISYDAVRYLKKLALPKKKTAIPFQMFTMPCIKTLLPSIILKTKPIFFTQFRRNQ
jgi:anthranilate synthase component 1